MLHVSCCTFVLLLIEKFTDELLQERREKILVHIGVFPNQEPRGPKS